MSERERKEQEILEYIQLAIQLYNEISENKVELKMQGTNAYDTPDMQQTETQNQKNNICSMTRGRINLVDDIHIPLGQKKQQAGCEEKLYVGSSFVCAYDEEVGLFKQTNWTEKNCNHFVSIYTSVQTGDIGIWETTTSVLGKKKQWLKRGETVTFKKSEHAKGQCQATCNMYAVMSFEEMRAMMRKMGKISGYSIAYASMAEIEEVLEFASQYFCQEMEKRKVFTKFSRR
jgi:hypothetical protein